MKQEPSQLIVDQTTPIQRPSDNQIKKWATGKRVFVSSTMDDLSDERRTAAEAISEIGAEPVMFETFGARSDDSRQAYKAEVRRSSIYLGILSRRYGVKQPSGYSATHAEYEEARKHRKELLLFLDSTVPQKDRDGHLNSWLDELYQVHVLAKYEDLDELARQIKTSLTELARKQITPWVKLGKLVFQATRITQETKDHATLVEVQTASNDPQVTSQISKIADQHPFGSTQVNITFRNRSYPVEVKGVEETIDPLGKDSLMIACERKRGQGQRRPASSISMLGGGITSGSERYSQKDLIELVLRRVVLGDSAVDDVPFVTDAPPLNLIPIHEKYNDDPEVFLNVARLLIIESILAQGLVEQLIDVQIESPHPDRIHVELSAVLPQQYVNEEPDTVDIAGEIDLR